MNEEQAHKLVVQRHFDAYAGGWHERLANHPFKSRYQAVKEMVEPLGKNTVLDIGCGTGDYCSLFDPGQTDYLGMDLSPEMINRCRELYPNFKFEVADGDSIDVSAGWAELVLDIAVIEYYDDPTPHMKELRRVVADDGHLIIAVPNGKNVTRELNSAIGSAAAKIKRLLKNEKRVKAAGGKDPRIMHRHKKIGEMARLAKDCGFELMDYKYVNVLLVPEVRPFIGRFNQWLSSQIGGKPIFRWVTSWSARILVCKMRPI